MKKHFINLNYLNKNLKKIENFILKYQKIDNVRVIELRKFVICYKIYKQTNFKVYNKALKNL